MSTIKVNFTLQHDNAAYLNLFSGSICLHLRVCLIKTSTYSCIQLSCSIQIYFIMITNIMPSAISFKGLCIFGAISSCNKNRKHDSSNLCKYV